MVHDRQITCSNGLSLLRPGVLGLLPSDDSDIRAHPLRYAENCYSMKAMLTELGGG